MARLLDELSATPATFVITARRCLLAGVLDLPGHRAARDRGPHRVSRASRASRGRCAGIRSRSTSPTRSSRRARHGDRARRASSARTTRRACASSTTRTICPRSRCSSRGHGRRLKTESRRILGVLSHIEGDHVDLDSLASLARVGGDVKRALAPLREWHLVQEPMRGRYAVHAVVRYAVARRTAFDPRRAFEHYVSLLEKRARPARPRADAPLRRDGPRAPERGPRRDAPRRAAPEEARRRRGRARAERGSRAPSALAGAESPSLPLPGLTVSIVSSTSARHEPLSWDSAAGSGIGTGKSDGGGRMVVFVRRIGSSVGFVPLQRWIGRRRPRLAGSLDASETFGGESIFPVPDGQPP